MLDLEKYNCNALGIRDMFIDYSVDCIKYDDKSNQFYKWKQEKGLWESVTNQVVLNAIEEFVMVDAIEIINGIDNERKHEFLEYLDKYGEGSRINRLLDDLKRKVRLDGEGFDSNPRYFNCMNAVFDFEAGVPIKHDKYLMLSMQSKFVISSKIKDNTWHRFLLDIACGDTELYAYLLRVILYAMQGSANQDCLFIFLGEKTRNGKSTFTNSIQYCFGSYGISVQPETITKGYKGSSGPRPDIVRMQGKRFGNIAEFDKRQKLDTSKVKAMTGGDNLAERGLYSDVVEFINRTVFCLHTNHMPLVDDDTIFKSGRIIVIPFNASFDQGNMDVQMVEKLTTPEAISGLFRLIAITYHKYKDMSIKEQLPKAVRREIKRFERESDYIGRFIKENISRGEDYKVSTTVLYNRFKPWARELGINHVSHSEFSRVLVAKGFEKKRWGSGYFFYGIKLHNL